MTRNISISNVYLITLLKHFFLIDQTPTSHRLILSDITNTHKDFSSSTMGKATPKALKPDIKQHDHMFNPNYPSHRLSTIHTPKPIHYPILTARIFLPFPNLAHYNIIILSLLPQNTIHIFLFL